MYIEPNGTVLNPSIRTYKKEHTLFNVHMVYRFSEFTQLPSKRYNTEALQRCPHSFSMYIQLAPSTTEMRPV